MKGQHNNVKFYRMNKSNEDFTYFPVEFNYLSHIETKGMLLEYLKNEFNQLEFRLPDFLTIKGSYFNKTQLLILINSLIEDNKIRKTESICSNF